METTTATPDPLQTPRLSDEHRAALTKYTMIDLRAHSAGVIVRELTESRREIAAALSRGRQHVEEIRKHQIQHRQPAIVSGDAGLRDVEREERIRFVNEQVAASRGLSERQRHRAALQVETLELKLALVDAELERATSAARPLQETRTAIRQHLINDGILNEQQDW